MHTPSCEAHPAKTQHADSVRANSARKSRWKSFRAAAGLSLFLLAGSACGGAQNSRSTITLSDGRSVPVIILDRDQSDTTISRMRNYISALSRILESMVDRTVDLSRFYEEPPFEGALGQVQVARTAREVAEEFVERCNAALTSGDETSPEEMQSLTDRYAFAHGLLVDALLKFRDGLSVKSNVRDLPASLGYPQIDLYGDL